MVIEKSIDKLPIRSSFVKVILGAFLVALLISLGMVGVLMLFGFSINPTISLPLVPIFPPFLGFYFLFIKIIK